MSDDIFKAIERSNAYEAAKAGLGWEDVQLLFTMNEQAAKRLVWDVQKLGKAKAK